jgi:Lipase (class 3)
MRKVIVVALASTIYILMGAGSSRAENQGYGKPDLIPKNSNELNLDRCRSDFKLCANIAESANTINYVYESGRSKEQTRTDALANLSKADNCGTDGRCYSDSRWDQGYTQKTNAKIDFIDESASLFGIGTVDVQAIVAQKEFYEGGVLKKRFLITIKGTEGGVDIINDGRAITRSIPVKKGSSAEVPLGFSESADKLMESPAFKSILADIQKSASSTNPKEDFEVLITGHSLGGATATAVKAKIQDELPDEYKSRVQAITFGSPPAGNREFNRIYGGNVTAVHIAGDPVSSAGNPIVAGRVGEQFEFRMTDEQVRLQNQLDEKLKWGWNGYGAILAVGAFKDLASEAILKTHAEGYNKKPERYQAATSPENGWYELNNQLMQQNLSGITQGGSSHISSAAYYLGRSPAQDNIDRLNSASQVEQFSGSRTPSIQQREEYTTPGSTTNLTAPVDIVLDWNQSVAKGQLDLDSHLTGPTSLGANSAVRFHTRFDDKGSITTAPYVQLYKDVIPASGGAGPEQTRIQVLQDGVYRFYVHDFTNRDAPVGSTALANSEANVNVYNFGKDLPQPGQNLGMPLGGQMNVPTDGRGNVWYVFQLDSRTGILKRVFIPFGNESDRALVPRIGEAPPTMTLPR